MFINYHLALFSELSLHSERFPGSYTLKTPPLLHLPWLLFIKFALVYPYGLNLGKNACKDKPNPCYTKPPVYGIIRKNNGSTQHNQEVAMIFPYDFRGQQEVSRRKNARFFCHIGFTLMPKDSVAEGTISVLHFLDVKLVSSLSAELKMILLGLPSLRKMSWERNREFWAVGILLICHINLSPPCFKQINRIWLVFLKNKRVLTYA